MELLQTRLLCDFIPGNLDNNIWGCCHLYMINLLLNSTTWLLIFFEGSYSLEHLVPFTQHIAECFLSLGSGLAIKPTLLVAASWIPIFAESPLFLPFDIDGVRYGFLHHASLSACLAWAKLLIRWILGAALVMACETGSCCTVNSVGRCVRYGMR